VEYCTKEDVFKTRRNTMAHEKISLQVHDLNEDLLELAIENASARRNSISMELSSEESKNINGGVSGIVSGTPVGVKCPPIVIVGIIIPPDRGLL
jgi:hypothetical protein